MCLIVFAWKVIPGTSLIAAGNRDEFYKRPAASACWWDDHPQIYAGRDLQGGGTWMGVTRDGRFAAITNIRALSERRTDATSRGALVADFLAGSMTARDYVAGLGDRADEFNGYNLLVGDRHELIWYSNRMQEDPRNGKSLPPGVYGLSNASLDSPWPKVVRTKAQFASLLCQCAPEAAYFEMLTDTTIASDCRLPKTGVAIELERVLSAVCIDTPNYGTRVSTVVQIHDNGTVAMNEQSVR
ncbi:MAG: NRDE family protein [Herminiimonas sp.]|nr:NRDE family protein [Herminiimonas sp.]